MIDVERTIISQYANSTTIVQLVRNMDGYLDPRADIDAFHDCVWNVNTAKGFGLDIWGRIVGVGRELVIPVDQEFFGFKDGVGLPFDQAAFYSGEPQATQSVSLEDEPYRQLIMLKALTNIISPTAESLNKLLRELFAGRGRCYVNDMGGMSFRYTFEFLLTPYELAIMSQSEVLPRPAGVGVNILSAELPLFGFAEAPFDQGAFFEGIVNAAI